jgi:3-oxoacid CoA-transferase subunit B
MEHTSKKGEPKIVEQCNLPLTGTKVVNRIITELGVLDVTPDGLVLIEIAPDVTPEQVVAATGAPLKVSEDLKLVGSGQKAVAGV